MAIPIVSIFDLYDVNHAVNGVGTLINGELVRDRWDHPATVRVIDHPADSEDSPALFSNKAVLKTWKLGGAKRGTAIVLEDLSGQDIVIPGGDQIVAPELPPRPTGFATGLITTTTIDLHWDSLWQDYDFNGFQIDRQIVGVDPTYVRIADLDQFATYLVVRDLPSDSLVRFRIRTYTSYVSLWSLAEGITDEDDGIVLPPVSTGEITNVTQGEQDLAWTYTHVEEPDGFRLEQLITGTDTEYQPLAELPFDTRTYSNTGLPDETLIFYRIRAEDGELLSEWGAGSEETLPTIDLELPVWSVVPPLEFDIEVLPASVPLAGYVTSPTDLVLWEYWPVIEGLSINQEGTLLFSAEMQVNSALITVNVANDDGTASSTPFSVKVTSEDVDEDVVLFTDDFNRPNGPLTAPWAMIDDKRLVVRNNQCGQETSSTIDGIAYWNVPLGPNQYVEFTVKAQPESGVLKSVNLGVRYIPISGNTESSSYTAVVSRTSLRITRFLDGVFTVLDSVPYTFQFNDRLRVVARDDILEVWLNNALTLSVTDNTLNPAQSYAVISIIDNDLNAHIDDFECGIPGGVPVTPPINAPHSLHVTNTGVSWLRLEWQHSGELSHFRLERLIVGTNIFWQELEPEINGTTRSYDDTELAANTVHQYRLRAERLSGEVSDWDETSGTTSDSDDLNDVYGLEIITNGATTQTLGWNYDGSGNTGFNVQHQVEGRDDGWVPLSSMYDPAQRTYLVEDLLPATKVNYQLRAFDADGVSSWDYTDGFTELPDTDVPPIWRVVPNFVEDEDNIPITIDMNEYVLSEDPITSWSVTQYLGVSITSGGILTMTRSGTWSMQVTATNDHGSNTSNSFTVTVDEGIGDVHFAPARFPLRMNNPRGRLDIPGNKTTLTMASWNRYQNTHSEIPYIVPVGVSGGRPPFRFSISGTSGFTVHAQAPDWNPGMTSWAEVRAAAGLSGSYTVTVTDMDGNSDSTLVTVTNDDSVFCFIAPDGSNSANGTFNNPIETCQGWYGATGSIPSRFNGHIVVYREGTYALPTDTGGSRSGGMVYGHSQCPLVHLAMPGESVSLTGALANRNGFHNNPGSSQTLTDMWWEGFTIEGNSVLGSMFRCWSQSHRQVFWNLTFKDFTTTVYSDDPDNFGGMVWLSSSEWSSSSVSVISCIAEGWRGPSVNNYCFYQTYGAIHHNVDNCGLKNCVGGPSEAFWHKGDSSFCSWTSLDTWETGLQMNRPGRSTFNMAPYYNDGSGRTEDYGMNWWESPNQMRYCRGYTNPSNHGNQNVRLCESGSNRVWCPTFMDRSTNCGWTASSSGNGVGTNPITRREMPPTVTRCFHFPNNPYDTHNFPSGFIVNESTVLPFNTMSVYLNADGSVKDNSQLYQMGWEVPLVPPLKFFSDEELANATDVEPE